MTAAMNPRTDAIAMRITAHTVRAMGMCICIACLITACGSDATTTARTTTVQSQVVNLTPPTDPDFDHEGPEFAPWSISRADNKITFTPRAVGTSPQSLTFASEHRVLGAMHWINRTGPAPSHSLLISTITAAGSFSCWQLQDTNGDTVPEMSTAAVLFVGGTNAMFVTRMVQEPGAHSLVMLDRRCQDIWIALDTDGSGVPDQLASTPFAKSANHPELLDTQILLSAAAGAVYIPAWSTYYPYGRTRTAEDFAGELVKLEDTDGAGLVDTVGAAAPPHSFPHF